MRYVKFLLAIPLFVALFIVFGKAHMSFAAGFSMNDFSSANQVQSFSMHSESNSQGNFSSENHISFPSSNCVCNECINNRCNENCERCNPCRQVACNGFTCVSNCCFSGSG